MIIAFIRELLKEILFLLIKSCIIVAIHRYFGFAALLIVIKCSFF